MQTRLSGTIDAQIISCLSIAINHLFSILDRKDINEADVEIINKVYEEISTATNLLNQKIDLKENKN